MTALRARHLGTMLLAVLGSSCTFRDQAARVNGQTITWENIYARFGGRKPGEIGRDLLLAEVRRQVQEQLFLQKADKLGLVVTDKEVDEVAERTAQACGSPDRFEEYLKFKKLSRAEFREETRRDLAQAKVHRRLVRADPGAFADERVRAEEIRAYYDAHRQDEFRGDRDMDVFRLALRWTTSEEKTKKHELIDALKQRLDTGEDFVDLACRYDEVGSKESGRRRVFLGKLRADNGLFSEETTRYLFETLPLRTVSRVVEDGSTFNLFYAFERTELPAKSIEEVEPSIRAALGKKKWDENHLRILGSLLKEAWLEPARLFQMKPGEYFR